MTDLRSVSAQRFREALGGGVGVPVHAACARRGAEDVA